MEKRTIIFDFDGTIANTFEHYITIYNAHADEYKLPKATPEILKKARQKSAWEIAKYLKIPPWRVPFLVNAFLKVAQKTIGRVKPCAGIPQILEKLDKRGCSLGIVSSNRKANITAFLKANRLDQYFGFIHSETNIFGKDKVLKHVLKTYSLNPKKVLYVGDEVRDIEACRKVGIKMAAVTWGFNTEDLLKKNKPDFLFNQPDDLLKTL